MTSKPKLNTRILVVEDEESIALLYRTKFEYEGFTVHLARDGIEGLALSETIRPDMILLDLRMPRMSGDEMLTKLRETKWGANIRVIILTNLSKDEAPSVLRFLNVDRYIVKAHHTPAQVVQIVKEILGIKD